MEVMDQYEALLAQRAKAVDNIKESTPNPPSGPKPGVKPATPPAVPWSKPGAKPGGQPSVPTDTDFPLPPSGKAVETTTKPPPPVVLAYNPKKPTPDVPTNKDTSNPDMPKMPSPPCSKDNPNIWPEDWHKADHRRPAFILMKQFPGVVCGKCKSSHPTALHEQCQLLFEVWTFKSTKGTCQNKDCEHPGSHDTASCGYGEFRDHPDNKIPKGLEAFARPWPAGALKQPLPIYYLKGIGKPPHAELPTLPKHCKDGVNKKVWNRQEGLEFSVALRLAVVKGAALPKCDAKSFRSDVQLGLVPTVKDEARQLVAVTLNVAAVPNMAVVPNAAAVTTMAILNSRSPTTGWMAERCRMILCRRVSRRSNSSGFL